MTEPVVEDRAELAEAAPETENMVESARNVWIPDGRSISEELRRPRYLALLFVAALVIALQFWVLF